jgi:hypothetical protein
VSRRLYLLFGGAFQTIRSSTQHPTQHTDNHPIQPLPFPHTSTTIQAAMSSSPPPPPPPPLLPSLPSSAHIASAVAADGYCVLRGLLRPAEVEGIRAMLEDVDGPRKYAYRVRSINQRINQ